MRLLVEVQLEYEEQVLMNHGKMKDISLWELIRKFHRFRYCVLVAVFMISLSEARISLGDYLYFIYFFAFLSC